MEAVLRPFDSLLNKFTMYKVIAFGLGALIAVSIVFGFLNLIGVSGLGILLSAVIAVPSCYLANRGLGMIFDAARNSESAAITGMILVFIVPPVDSLSRGLLVVVACIAAMASKYLITWRGSHVFNPVAFGAFAVSVTGVLPSIWWVATPYLLPFTALLALIVLRKQQDFAMFNVFAVAAIAMLALNGLVIHHNMDAVPLLKTVIVSYPIVFLGSIMLTEPFTMPADKTYQLYFAAIVGVVFGAQLSVGPISTTPQFALLVGNLFAVFVTVRFGATVFLQQSRRLADDIYEVVFAKPANLQFTAGQYLEMTLPGVNLDSRGNRRSFSLASAPSEPELRFAVRTFDKGSNFKKVLTNLTDKTAVRVANVKGSFILADSKDKVLLIAGGIGVTPYRSMVAELVARKQQRDITLVYVASDEDQFVFKELFKQAASNGLNTEYVVGRLRFDDLKQLVPDIDERQVYISGPDGLVRNYKSAMLQSGLRRRQIHTDHFSGY